MNGEKPRRIGVSILAACLFAAAPAIFWPAKDFPRLRQASLEKGSVPAGKQASFFQTQSPEASSSTETQRPFQGDTPPEDLRDAPASVTTPTPHLKGGIPVLWTPTSWRAYWRQSNGQKLEIPVPQQTPPSFKRGSDARGVPMKSPTIRMQNHPQTPGRETQSSKPWSSALDSERFSPSAISRRIQEARAAFKRLASGHETGHAQSAAGSSSSHTKTSSTDSSKAATPEPKPKERRKHSKPIKFKPILLSKLLGKDAIRPPKINISPPNMSHLPAEAPEIGPNGKPLTWSAAQPEAVEASRPPQKSCHRPDGHWHDKAYHDRAVWARPDKEGWLWQEKSGGHWWAFTKPSEPTWLWNGGHWWWKSDGIWFLLHQGQAWGYRLFNEERQEGLIHPRTGTQMVYSKDGSRVALITPGDGAWLFDAMTGETLGRWTEDQMPAKRQPRAPTSLSLP